MRATCAGACGASRHSAAAPGPVHAAGEAATEHCQGSPCHEISCRAVPRRAALWLTSCCRADQPAGRARAGKAAHHYQPRAGARHAAGGQVPPSAPCLLPAPSPSHAHACAGCSCAPLVRLSRIEEPLLQFEAFMALTNLASVGSAVRLRMLKEKVRLLLWRRHCAHQRVLTRGRCCMRASWGSAHPTTWCGEPPRS